MGTSDIHDTTHSRRVLVIGPAYLDRVVRVDSPLLPAPWNQLDGPVDRSIEGVWDRVEPGLTLQDPELGRLKIALPQDWPGPNGRVLLNSALRPGSGPWNHSVHCVDWLDDLGGMGAGFAKALDGTLVSALGPDDDPTSNAVRRLLQAQGINHEPLVIPDRAADWTLLITSGPHGDKLPVGLRGCHSAIKVEAIEREGNRHESDLLDLLVVASLPNPLALKALQAVPARLRMFAPAMRNMSDRSSPVRVWDSLDLLFCNRDEWLAAGEPSELYRRCALVAITDGPRGASVWFNHGNDFETIAAFPRLSPPTDTNRAGEAFASTLVTTLLDSGWSNRQDRIAPEHLRVALLRASAAAALVIDRPRFGFASRQEVDKALAAGRVAP